MHRRADALFVGKGVDSKLLWGEAEAIATDHAHGGRGRGGLDESVQYVDVLVAERLSFEEACPIASDAGANEQQREKPRRVPDAQGIETRLFELGEVVTGVVQQDAK